MLQANHNYFERGMKALLFTAKLDNREGLGFISSRIGIKKKAHAFSQDDNLFDFVQKEQGTGKLDCILVDEAQFLNQAQVRQLTKIVDTAGIPVLT